ncbi:hypothetical protein [Kyrpidia tusciae]|uniref:hypothetical protein n=1 Tax=Kyrpidia tusciae TaxID=33943 RepID=UPI0002EB7BFF|nr:hypothetical protein [Kyrpidia tusciae]
MFDLARRIWEARGGRTGGTGVKRRKKAPGLWLQRFVQIRGDGGAPGDDGFRLAPGDPRVVEVGEGEAADGGKDGLMGRVRPAVLYRWQEGTTRWTAADMLEQVWQVDWLAPLSGVRGEIGERAQWEAEVEVQRATPRFGSGVRVEGTLRVTAVGPAPGEVSLESAPLYYERRKIPFTLILGEEVFPGDQRRAPLTANLPKVGRASSGGWGGPEDLFGFDEPRHVTTSDWKAQVLIYSLPGRHAGGSPTVWIRVTGRVALWIRVISPMPG